MEHKHNADFTTKWELINQEGQIVQKGGNLDDPVCEGTFSYQVLNKRKEVVYEHEQPMKSFTMGFLKAFITGHRLAKRNESYGQLPNSVGHCRTDSKVYVQNIGLIYPFNNFSDNAWTTSSIASTTVGYTLESLSYTSDSVRVVVSCERDISSGSGNITETALYCENYPRVSNSDDYKQGMIAREVFTTPATFIVDGFIKLKWTIDFPTSSNKSLTMNWIKNFIQNVVVSNYDDFVQLDGTTMASGSSGITGQSFTKEANCRGGSGVDDMGIVIGTSNSSVSYNDSHLGNQIGTGTGSGQMQYQVMGQTREDSVMIHPTEGKADCYFSRNFINNSGSSITVKEAGLVAKVNETDPTTQGISANGSYLLARWLTGDIVVPNGYTLKIYFQLQVTATPEDHSNIDESQIILVTDEMRTLHSGLRNISMIQKNVQDPDARYGANWTNSVMYASNLSLLGYSDWRLPVQRNTQVNDSEVNELATIIGNYKNQLVGYPSSGYILSYNEATTSSIFCVYGSSVSSINKAGNLNYHKYFFCVR
jgi:hypothetical protein